MVICWVKMCDFNSPAKIATVHWAYPAVDSSRITTGEGLGVGWVGGWVGAGVGGWRLGVRGWSIAGVAVVVVVEEVALTVAMLVEPVPTIAHPSCLSFPSTPASACLPPFPPSLHPPTHLSPPHHTPP